MEILKKLSTAKLVGKVTFKEGETEKSLFKVFGIATGIITGTSTFGPWEALTGQFCAIIDDKEYRSGVCFLPPLAHSLISGALAGEGAANVAFAFLIGVRKSTISNMGYEYTAVPLIPIGESDPLGALKTKVLPKPEPEHSPESAPGQKQGHKK